MFGWPGSVSSSLIMQLVSEEAEERGCSTVKPGRLGSRWSDEGPSLLQGSRRNGSTPGRWQEWATEGGGDNRDFETCVNMKDCSR